MKKSRKKFPVLPILLIFAVLAGLGMACYPAFSAWYLERTGAEVLTDYYEEVADRDRNELQAVLASALAYNQKLAAGEYSGLDPAENGYYDELNILGNGIMGYLEIPKIDVCLPIYHGIGSDAMSLGCGHMPQSSLPVGGESTHAVLSSHTGSASAALFTNLEQLETGDVFYIHILDLTLTYEVDRISVVLPTEIDCVAIEDGKDLVTLVTCTPYGVNSHRLLVRGSRAKIEYQPGIADAVDEAAVPSAWTVKYGQALLMGLALAALVLLCGAAIHGAARAWRKRHDKG